MNAEERARAIALATSIKALSQGPAIHGLAVELLGLLEGVSVAAAGANQVEPQTPRAPAADQTEVIAPPPASGTLASSEARPPSRDAIRARARREKLRLAQQLGLPGVDGADAPADRSRPVATAVDPGRDRGRDRRLSLSDLEDLNSQRSERDGGRDRGRVTVDHTTELDDELRAAAVREMDERGVAFDVVAAWKKFRAHLAGRRVTRAQLLARWIAWCARERPDAAPGRPLERAAGSPPPVAMPPLPEDLDGDLEPERPPPEFLEAGAGVRRDLAEYELRHSFRRFAERHPTHATAAAALEYFLRWLRLEDTSRIGPKRTRAPDHGEFALPYPRAGDDEGTGPPAARASA